MEKEWKNGLKAVDKLHFPAPIPEKVVDNWTESRGNCTGFVDNLH